jgi:hypothetical protein
LLGILEGKYIFTISLHKSMDHTLYIKTEDFLSFVNQNCSHTIQKNTLHIIFFHSPKTLHFMHFPKTVKKLTKNWAWPCLILHLFIILNLFLATLSNWKLLFLYCFKEASSMAVQVWSYLKPLHAKQPSSTIIWRALLHLFHH